MNGGSTVARAAGTPASTGAPVVFDDVAAAAARLAGVAHRTPVVTSRTVDDKVGAQIFFKCENLQRGGAFKFRGAHNALSQLNQEQRTRGVITYSSGNHAQAVALAGRLLGIPATIVMPQDAPPVKLAATRGYGGEVITYDKHETTREALAGRMMRRGPSRRGRCTRCRTPRPSPTAADPSCREVRS